MDVKASQKQLEELKSAHESDNEEKAAIEINDYDDKGYQAVITKYDVDNASAITFLTEATSALAS